jgi:hypothetical protein
MSRVRIPCPALIGGGADLGLLDSHGRRSELARDPYEGESLCKLERGEAAGDCDDLVAPLDGYPEDLARTPQHVGVPSRDDEASLDHELATLSSFGPTENTSLRRIVVRLALATPAELRALVGRPGLRLCSRQGAKKGCASIAQASIDEKRVAQIAAHAGPFAVFSSGEDETELERPACKPDADASPHFLGPVWAKNRLKNSWPRTISS